MSFIGTNNLKLTEKLNNGLIFIASDKLNGFGDLSCGRRVADLLHELGGIPTEQIVICSDSRDDFNKVFNADRKFRVIHPTEATSLTNIKILIAAPRLYLKSETAVSGVPVIYLHEYNHGYTRVVIEGHYHEYSMGLDSHVPSETIGILIDPDLHSWSQSEAAQDPFRRAELLDRLPVDWRAAIMNGKTAEEFAKSSHLYIGYAYEAVFKQGFITALLKMETENERDLVIAMPGSLNLSFLDQFPLQNCGIGKYEVFVGRDGNIERSQTESISDEGKTLTILLGLFPNTIVRTLWKASERETIATGDQSLSEAISANKSFLYEVREYKTKLGNSLDNLYGRNKSHSVFWGNLSRSFLEQFQHYRQDNHSKSTQGNLNIIQNHNANRKILETVSEILVQGESLPKILDMTQFPLEQFRPAELPFDQPVQMTFKQVQKVEIQTETGTSEREDLADSFFNWKLMSLELYLVTRRRKEVHSVPSN